MHITGNQYIYIFFYFETYFYNTNGVKKIPDDEICKKRYYTNWYLEKKFNKKKEKTKNISIARK